ncbi:uncharacterized protein DSM5745_08173 [Aspergillus mulundensis]|uniref:LysM domain-containing protein n=1 Tax=Aspergillus mulundensis TaxID=1810919 RepID=A0A3D8R9D3_9EURO|nr:hypothetical protein DSM5745_08173 [Aspergillus mulundensis]RDW70662.1 hypothetical protein DSM5745_08173 [Aspergillus mulundensis]
MHSIHLLAGLLPALASALSRRHVECLFATTPGSSDTCQTFASTWGLSVSELQELNPGISCPSLDASQSYCVIGTVTETPPGTTLTTTTSTSTTTTTSTRTTTTTQPPTTANPTVPSPTMPGIAENCDQFYQISPGDQCGTIAQRHGITTGQLLSWNSEINADCTNLWLDYYICVHVPGSTTTSAAPEPTEDPSTPTPLMPGTAANCDEFHQVVSGDQCGTIAQAHGITLAQFRSWNTEINADCTNLWVDYYVCVHVPGTTTTVPATPEPTEDPTGPTPQLPGTVSNCKAFHLIASGDSCWSIYTEAGITLAQLRQWNSHIDAACSNLWLGYYVCVGV